MKYVPKTANLDSKLLGILLTPSWLSAMLVLLCSLTVCLGTILSLHYQSSSIRLDFLDYRAGQLSQSYQRVSDQLLSNTVLGNLPLLIFWGLVGLVVYLFAANVIASIRSTAEINDELHYVHADRHQILWRPLQHLLLHLVVLTVWTVYILFFFHHILPYCVAASIVGAGMLSIWQSGSYALLAILVMSVALHLHVILLRLLLLRPRIFSPELYVDVG